MNITFSSLIGNNNFIRVNNINSAKPVQTALLDRACPCDEVCFTGTSDKDLPKNEHDQVFCKVIARDLKLDEAQTQILYKTVSDFIKENGIDSLADLDCEDEDGNIDDEKEWLQVDLQGRILDNLGYGEDRPDEIGEFVAGEIVHRAGKGDNYITTGLRVSKVRPIESLFTFNESSDTNFYKAVKILLNLTPTQLFDFQTIVGDELEKHNFTYVKDLVDADEKDFMLGNTDSYRLPELLDNLTDEFKLSDKEREKLQSLFFNRSETRLFDAEDALRELKLEDDMPILSRVLNLAGCDDGTKEGKLFCGRFCYMMEQEANKNKCSSLFELFKDENIKKGKAKVLIEFIENSNLPVDRKNNLLLDLVKAAKSTQDITMPLTESNFKASAYSCMMTDRFCEEFGIPEDDKIYSDISKVFKQLFPKYIVDKDIAIHQMFGHTPTDFNKAFPCFSMAGKEAKPIEVAFRLADKYKLPVGAESTIIDIINEVSSKPEFEVDRYIFGSIIDAKSDEADDEE